MCKNEKKHKKIDEDRYQLVKMETVDKHVPVGMSISRLILVEQHGHKLSLDFSVIVELPREVRSGG